MKMQGIQLQAVHLLGGSSAHKISGLSNSKSSAFGEFMEKSLTTDHKSKLKQNIESKVSKTENTKNDLVNSQKKALKDVTVSESQTGNKTAEIDHTSNEDLTVEQQMINQIEEKISAIVKDTLGMTEEELEELLAKMGMSIMDLLLPQNLQMLVLQQAGESDVSAFLCNENLVQTMNQLRTGMESVLTEMEVTPEEIQSMLAKLEATTAKEAAPAFRVSEQPDQKSNLAKEMEETPKEVFKVVVEKEETSNSNQQEHMNSSKEEANVEQDHPSMQKSEEQQDNKTVSASEQFMQHLVDAKGTGEVEVHTEKVQQLREITNQILEQVRVTIKPGSTSMEFQLNPEHLGKVNFSVVAKDGQMTASFVVQNQMAKEAIEGSLQVLRENLEGQGIKVDAVEVTVSNFGFDQRGFQEQNNQDGKKKNARKINMDQFRGSAVDELSEEELNSESSITENSNHVDYTA